MIEMLRSWTETFGKLLQSAFSWTEHDDMLWARQLVAMVKTKERQVDDDERVPPNVNAPGDVPPIVFKDLAAVGGPGHAHST